MTQTPEERSAAANAARLYLLYRLTPEQQIAIEEYQRRNSLAILMGHTTESTGTDHDHKTGLIRGRMDFRLNKALGLVEAFADKLSNEEFFRLGYHPAFSKTATVLRAMAAYMEHLPAPAAIGNVYGLIGKAKRKKKMIYGSPNGPLPVEKKKR